MTPQATAATRGRSDGSTTQALDELCAGARALASMTVAPRVRLLTQCLDGVAENAAAWIDLACEAKRIPAGSGARAEEITAGPIATLRCLYLLRKSLQDAASRGKPRLPGAPAFRNGRWRVPVFPTRELFDALLFGPMKAETRLTAGPEETNLHGDRVARATGTADASPRVALVLGAGNVSSIPITDALYKIFQSGQSVLLKMNPVNAYLAPVFERAFSPLVDAGLLRVVAGGGDLGARLIGSDQVDTVHITGSANTHDAIVWGTDAGVREEPLLKKPITSELGNVSPWVVVPGRYTERQLQFQAENVASSIANNASFNCVATKMIVTSRRWPQRERFLDLLDAVLARTPARHPYYPGAEERFERFSGSQASVSSDALPWTLLRDASPESRPELFHEESFVCVTAETALDATSMEDFLNRATEFANDQLWGTLAAALTVPPELQKRDPERLDRMIDELRYGIIGVNQWPGVAFALMSPSWGAYPGSTLGDVQSGIGVVHNTYLLDHIEKTVLMSPLTIWPKPIWFSTHRRPVRVADRLLALYSKPSLGNLASLLVEAVRG